MKQYLEVLKDLEHSIHNSGDLSVMIKSVIEHKQHDLPSELVNWVLKVANYSYKTLDREVDELNKVGVGDSQIFEATVIAAHSASKNILTKGLSLLNDEA